jgi:hypothetical protein
MMDLDEENFNSEQLMIRNFAKKKMLIAEA